MRTGRGSVRDAAAEPRPWLEGNCSGIAPGCGDGERYEAGLAAAGGDGLIMEIGIVVR